MKKSIFILLFCLLFLKTSNSFSQYHWEQLPGLFGGKINEIIIDASGTLFAQSAHHLYMSTNKGETWNKLNEPKQLDGKSWPSIEAFFSTGIKLYLTGTTSGPFNGNYKSYVSTDKGKFWYSTEDIPDNSFRIWTDNSNGFVYLWYWENSLLKQDMKTGKTTLICDKSLNEPKQMQFLSKGKILLRTEKYNETTRSNDSFLDLFDPDSCSHQNIKFDKGNIGSVCVTKTGEIFIVALDGIYQSTDQGKTWNRSLPLNHYAKMLTSSPNGYVYILFHNYEIVFTDKNNIRQELRKQDKYTDDNGKTWKELISPFKKIEKLICDNDDILYAITELGVAKNENSTWKLINNGITETHVNSVSFDKSNNLFAGTWGYGILKRKSGSKAWETFYFDSSDYKTIQLMRDEYYKRRILGYPAREANYIANIYFERNDKILAFTTRGILKSQDNGKTWDSIPYPTNSSGIRKMIPDSSGNIYAMNLDSLFITRDEGHNWEQIFPKKDSLFIMDFSVDSKNNLFISTSNIKYRNGKQKTFTYLSKDMGKSWSLLKPILRKSWMHSDPVNDNSYIQLYSSRYGQTYAFEKNVLYRFVPDSSSWLQLGENEESSVNNILKTKDGRLLIFHWSYFSISENDSVPRIYFYKGLENSHINDLAEDYNGEIYAATDDGIYILRHDDIKTNSIVTLETDSLIIKPNPVKYDGEIIFKLKAKSEVNIRFTDSNGRDNYLFYNTHYPQGVNRVEFNVSSLKPGNYECKLVVDKKNIVVRKFEVVR